MERKESKLKLVGKQEEVKQDELKPLELNTLFVCMYDDENLVSMGNHAVGFCERHVRSDSRPLAKFREVALIDPNFIAMTEVGTLLVFEDMEMIVVDNPKSDMDEEELEDWGY